MPKPVNNLAVLKDALMQVGASIRRNKRATKHIAKLNNIDYLHLLTEIIRKQEILEMCLAKDLRLEQKRVKTPSIVKG